MSRYKIHILLCLICAIVFTISLISGNSSLSLAILGYPASVGDYYLLRFLLSFNTPDKMPKKRLMFASLNIFLIFGLFIIVFLSKFINFLMFAGLFIFTRYGLIFAFFKDDQVRLAGKDL
jgi:hypothetical protein